MKLGMLNLLTLIFVAAKLFGAIDWSWLLVLLPTIVSGVIGLLLIAAVLVAAVLGEK